MAELHEALKLLSPVEWGDIPQDNLSEYLSDCFKAGELICNSVPQNPNGTPFHTSKPHLSTPNSAKSHKDMHPSSARGPQPHEDHEGLQKNWGKPMKFSQASNPLHVCVYKMAGHDRHGAWFARRSIHEGLGFDKFKRAMAREFPESMTVTGGPGAGAVRGLAADRRLERKEVKDVGKLEVYELSAQFPGPVTPRDFMTMLLSSENALTEKSAAGDKKHIPRNLMMVSRPVDHPDAPERSGYVRGQYESVEMIREIPLSTAKAASTSDLPSHSQGASPGRDRGNTAGSVASDGKATGKEQLDVPSSGADELQHDPELNPVEWIMITRSDPGGGIPRFLVDRGTPETMLTDIHKFLTWACSKDSVPHADDDIEEQEIASKQVAAENGASSDATGKPENGHRAEASTHHAPANSPASTDHAHHQQGGILQNLTHALEAGIDAYAPAAVSHLFHEHLYPAQASTHVADDSSDTSSVHSFLSADELQKVETAPEHPPPIDFVDNLSIKSEASDSSKHSRNPSRHEKDMQKLAQKRQRLDQQLAKKRMAEEEKLRQAQAKDEVEANKQKEKIEKDLKKIEEKHRIDIEKLEQKREKEARKAEERRRKKDDQNKLSLVVRERDDFRGQVDLYRRENQLLRAQVEALQVQNNAMAARLGKMGGADALKGMQEGFGRSRTSSMRSRESGESMSRSIDKMVEGGTTA